MLLQATAQLTFTACFVLNPNNLQYLYFNLMALTFRVQSLIFDQIQESNYCLLKQQHSIKLFAFVNLTFIVKRTP
ncbi:MAG: hypothetical protein ACK55Z_17040, partial [bacterium]